MITKLAIFDFDGTLVQSPLPETGKIIYQEKTGKPYPHKGWWSKDESLDISIFDVPTNPSVIEDYHKEMAVITTLKIMLTGRLPRMAGYVEEILSQHGLVFDKYLYNTGGATEVSKKKTMDELLVLFPDVKSVELWEDREPHVQVFEQWGQEKIDSGVLTEFKVNFIISDNHSKEPTL